ncbi:MAG TPA: oligosaccharide flippase family protein [Candidatus Methanoperedens sp.]
MINKLLDELYQSKTFLRFTLLKIFGQLISFSIPLMIAKIFSPEKFGSYSLIMLILFFFTSVFIFSFQTPFIAFAIEEYQNSSKINKTFSIQLFFFVVSIILFLISIFNFKSYIINFSNISDKQLIYFFLAYLGIGLNSFVENLFLALNRRICSSLYYSIYGIFNLVLFAYYYDNLDLNMILSIYFISSVLSTTIFITKIQINKLFPLIIDKKLFFEMLHWSKWQIMGSTAIFFINWGDNIILRYFVSIEKIGYYNLGYQIFKGLISLTYIISSYFMPFISININNKQKIYDYLFIKRIKIVFLGISILSFIFITIPYFLSLIFGNIYEESIVIIRILLVGNLFFLFQIFYAPIVYGHKDYKFIAFVNIVQMCINLIADVVLIYSFGIMGAAFATIIGYSISFCFFEIYIRKNIKVKIL